MIVGLGIDAIGAVATEFLCGVIIVAVGIAGWIVCRRIEDRDRAGAAAPSPASGN